MALSIWVLRGKSATIAWLEDAPKRGNLLCSVLTISELFRMMQHGELLKSDALLDTPQGMRVFSEDARRAADVMQKHGPGSVDCHIAAAARRLDAQVMTHNRQDVERTGVFPIAAPE